MITLKQSIVLTSVCFFAIALTIYFKDSKQRILTVDVNLLMEEAVKDIAKKDESEDKIKSLTEQKLQEFNELLNAIAADEKAVIFNKRAVVGGGEDITAAVRNLLEDQNEK